MTESSGGAASRPLDVTPGMGASQTDAATATTATSVVKGGLWGTAGGLVPQVYTLAMSVIAARVLGPEEFGRQSFIAFVELTVVMLFTGGVPLALMRYFGERIGAGNAEGVRSLVAWAWALELVAAIAGGAILVGAAVAGAEPEAAWLLAGIAAAMGVLHTVPSALLLGAQRWRAAAVVGLTTGALSTGATAAVLAAGGGITGIFAVEAAVSVVNLVWTTWLARRTLRDVAPRTREPKSVSNRGVWTYAAVSTIGAVLTFIVWRRSELFLLERFSSDTEIGLFSIAFAAVSALIRFPDAIATVAIAATATLFGAGAEERIRVGYGRALRLLLVFTVPLTAGTIALGPELLRLAYGNEFRETGLLLIILVATFPVVPVMTVATSVLIGLGRLRAPVAITAAGAVVNVVLAFALIPRYDAVGAAFASAGAQTIAAVLAFVATRRAVGEIDWEPRSVIRILVAAGGVAASCIGGLALADGWAGLAFGFVSGTLAYLVLARLLRILSAQDAQWLESAAGARLGGRVGRYARLCAAP